MTTESCARCRSARVVQGECGTGRGIGSGFAPRGLGWWSRNVFGGSVGPVRPGVTACLDCGLVWYEVRPRQLRALIERQGGPELQARLPPAPWPPPGTAPPPADPQG